MVNKTARYVNDVMGGSLVECQRVWHLTCVDSVTDGADGQQNGRIGRPDASYPAAEHDRALRTKMNSTSALWKRTLYFHRNIVDLNC